MKTLSVLVAFALQALAVFGAVLDVGPGQTYTSFTAAMSACSSGDTLLVHPGTITENCDFSSGPTRHRITVTGQDRDSCILIGRWKPSGTNWTWANLHIKDWKAVNHGIWIDGNEQCTVTNCWIEGKTQDYGGNASGIYVRNSYRTLIVSNYIVGETNNGLQKGVNVSSSKSRNLTVDWGTVCRGNIISNVPQDAFNVHGDYGLIEGNICYKLIDQNWLANHPDGIQFINSTIDGMTNCNHWVVRYNYFEDPTQAIFLEGDAAADSGFFCNDVQIYRNIVFCHNGVVNGVDMTTISGVKGVLCRGAANVLIYNNLFYDANGYAISTTRKTNPYFGIKIKNNIVYKPFIGGGISIEYAGDMPDGSIDYNACYTPGGNAYSWDRDVNGVGPYVQQAFATRALFKVSVTNHFEAATLPGSDGSADPLLNALPTPTLQSTSPYIDAGLNLGSTFTLDALGNDDSLNGSSWELGPFVYTVGGGVVPTSGKTSTHSGFRSIR